MSAFLGILSAFSVIVCTFFILANHNRGPRGHYKDLQVVTLRDLPPNIYFTIMDMDNDGYIIDVMERLPNNNLVSTREQLRLTGEKDLNSRFTYYVFETMLNGTRRYLQPADCSTSPAA